jgi:hypothetical protein
MPLALVTGPEDLLGSAGAALGRAGFDVVTGETPPSPSAGPFDCYVQLPCRPSPAGRRDGLSASDLVCRIDALAAVAGQLGPDASVILGVDDDADLLAAVALALLEDLGRPATRLAVLPVEDLCRPAAAPVGAPQWEMPTPPLVSAP